MAKPTTVTKDRAINGKVTNPRDIEFPFDKYGFTTLLRKEGVRAVGRIKADPAKLEVFKNTLRVLAHHADAKFKDQHADAKSRADAEKARVEEMKARNKADQEREIGRIEKMLDSMKANLKAQMGE